MKSSQAGIAKFWLIVIILLIVVLGAGAGAAWMLLNKHPMRADGKTVATTAAPERPSKSVFFGLDSFTVNLEGGDRLLYVGITLQLGDDSTEEFLKAHLPQVRNRLLMVLSGQDAQALITSEGKQKLAETIRQALLKQFSGAQPALLVDKVLFTQFIVQ